MLERFSNASATRTPISTLWVGVAQTTPTVTDTDLIRPVPIITTTVETVDACDLTTGWTAGTDSTAASLNSTTYKEGTKSLNLGKSGTSGTQFSYSKTVTSYDFTSKTVFTWVYITTLSELISSGTAITIRYGSDASNYYYKDFDISSLSTGWNLLYFTSATATGTTGAPVIAASDYFAILFNTDLAADLVTTGHVLLDYIHLVSSGDYPTTFSSGYPTNPGVNMQNEIRSQVNDIQGNGYQINGAAFKNTDSTPLVGIIMSFATVAKSSSIQLTCFARPKIRHKLSAI